MSKKLKRCIFGGRFDPVHKAHIQTALDVFKAFNIDQMHLIPTYNPPHREPAVASFEQRCTMLGIAIEPLFGFVVDKTEQQSEAKSYTYHTLLNFKQQYPNDALYLMMGSDAFLQLQTWYNWRSVLKLCEIIVDQRPGEQIVQIEKQKKQMKQEVKEAEIHFCEVSQMDISSSEIRDKLKQGFDTNEQLNKQVLAYIKANNIYS